MLGPFWRIPSAIPGGLKIGRLVLKCHIRRKSQARGVGSNFRIRSVEFVRCSKCQDGACWRQGCCSQDWAGTRDRDTVRKSWPSAGSSAQSQMSSALPLPLGTASGDRTCLYALIIYSVQSKTVFHQLNESG